LTTIIAPEPNMLLVGQAANAAEAIAELRRHRPDITLMDLRPPGTNGTDTLISIRGEYPDARIIILTTSDGDADIHRAMRAGARHHLPDEQRASAVTDCKDRKAASTAGRRIQPGLIL
jgi:DNA-binding NarL/FixJ family response regulator